MVRDLLRMLQSPLVLEVRRDPDGTEGMVADFGRDTGGGDIVVQLLRQPGTEMHFVFFAAPFRAAAPSHANPR